MLAKARLSSTDPLLSELYIAWAEKLTEEHNVSQAAKK